MDNDRNELLKALIKRCAAQDQSALRALYDETSAYLNRVSFNIVRSEDWSNDVLQEGFLQIWHNAASYREDLSAPLTWMSSIIRYRALDKMAYEKRHAGHTELESLIDSLPSADDTPEDEMRRSDEQRAFMECMATLDSRSKQCVQLAYLRGCSREEMAQTFETNTNTIKSWLHRSVKRLSSCLEKKQQAPL